MSRFDIFPVGPFGSSFTMIDAARILVRRQALARERLHRLGVEADAVPRRRARRARPPPRRAPRRGRRRPPPRAPRAREQHLLDLARVDVVAGADDEVLLSVDEEEIAIVVDVADVARRKPSVAIDDRVGSFLVRAISAHDAWTPDLNLAAFTDGQRRACRDIDDSDLAPRKRGPDRLRLSRAGQRRARDAAADLAHTVAFAQRALERLFYGARHLRRERGAARHARNATAAHPLPCAPRVAERRTWAAPPRRP